jgi:hypothetical protein
VFSDTAEISDGRHPPNDLVIEQCVGAGDSSHMAMIGNVRLSPFGRIIITITCVSMQLDVMITKWGEGNIICLCQSDKRFAVQDDCPDKTIKRLDATCEDLNIEIKNR